MGESPSASDRIERSGSISLENSMRLASDAAGISGKTAVALSLQIIVSVAMSHTKAAWPSEARMVETCGKAAVTIASFRDTAGRFPVLKDTACFDIDPRQ